MEDYCVWLWWDTSVLLFSPLKYNGYGAQVPSEAAANSCYGDAIQSWGRKSSCELCCRLHLSCLSRSTELWCIWRGIMGELIEVIVRIRWGWWRWQWRVFYSYNDNNDWYMHASMDGCHFVLGIIKKNAMIFRQAIFAYWISVFLVSSLSYFS